MRLVVLVSVMVGVVLLAACDSGASPADQAEPAGMATAVLEAVCNAAERADAGDASEAQTIFLDRAHQALHELAAEAATVDRPAAAQLLEAKEATESRLDAADAPGLATLLSDLAAATRAALTAVDGSDPGPCQESP